ncbi:hypothetical protein ACFY6U_34380 [Streptomyces sp. NPDC013157]|uniref:hypothetical protein n=1 Tax=Streptomyces sp. NPDC013157 TaxID=3364861 RepID=UPI0036C95BA0
MRTRTRVRAGTVRGARVRAVRRTEPAAWATTPTEPAAPEATPEPSAAGAVAALAAVVVVLFSLLIGMVAQLLPEPEGHRTAGTE